MNVCATVFFFVCLLFCIWQPLVDDQSRGCSPTCCEWLLEVAGSRWCVIGCSELKRCCTENLSLWRWMGSISSLCSKLEIEPEIECSKLEIVCYTNYFVNSPFTLQVNGECSQTSWCLPCTLLSGSDQNNHKVVFGAAPSSQPNSPNTSQQSPATTRRLVREYTIFPGVWRLQGTL